MHRGPENALQSHPGGKRLRRPKKWWEGKMTRCPNSQKSEVQEPFSSRLAWIFPAGKCSIGKKENPIFLHNLLCPHPSAQHLSLSSHPALHRIWDISSFLLPPAFPFHGFFQVLEKNGGNAGDPWLGRISLAIFGWFSDRWSETTKFRLLPCVGGKSRREGRGQRSKEAAPGCGANK